MAVRDNQLVAQALVIALSVIMDKVLSDRVACRPFADTQSLPVAGD